MPTEQETARPIHFLVGRFEPTAFSWTGLVYKHSYVVARGVKGQITSTTDLPGMFEKPSDSHNAVAKMPIKPCAFVVKFPNSQEIPSLANGSYSRIQDMLA
jgi:hypothetical protein